MVAFAPFGVAESAPVTINSQFAQAVKNWCSEMDSFFWLWTVWGGWSAASG
jgi:hypothetical protein